MSHTTIYIDPGSNKYIAESKDIERQYIEACEWISEFGIEYKKTRFGAYENDLNEYTKNKSKVGAKEAVRISMNARLEANELIRLKTTLESIDSTEIIETIKKAVSGQRFRNASKSDQSRDFAFELGVASRFVKAGYHVDLRSVSDLVVDINGRTLYVECKRIKSLKQLEKRVKAANKQIKKRIEQDKSSKSRGMIALNLTDIINSDAEPVITPSLEIYRQQSADTLKEFLITNKSTLSKGKHSKCLGVLTEFSTQAFINNPSIEESAFAYIRESNVYQYQLKKEDSEFLYSFMLKLGNQHIL